VPNWRRVTAGSRNWSNHSPMRPNTLPWPATSSTPDYARAPLRRAILLRLGTSPNHPGSVVRCFSAAHPPAWDDAPEPMPDWELLQQPAPDFAFDQRMAW
jgi:hypothetical protein